MKKASGPVRAIRYPTSPKFRWTARSTAAQSTEEINERSRAAVEEAKLAVEDARLIIADSKTLAAKLKAWRRAITHPALLNR